MITQIWKYRLREQGIEMPMDAKVLSVQLQDDIPHIWAMVNPHRERELRNFVIIGTGQSFDDTNMKYIGTYQHNPFVWHLFEIVK
jgi:hypothetical protein